MVADGGGESSAMMQGSRRLPLGWRMGINTASAGFTNLPTYVSSVTLSAKMGYGDVFNTPNRIDVNVCPVGGKANQRGLVKFEGKEGKTGEKDWMHCNSVSYDARHDRVAISLNVQSEIILVDHSRANRGVLWRYGNPRNFRDGDRMDQVLFDQHAAQFVNDGKHILCFNNGRRPDRWWS